MWAGKRVITINQQPKPRFPWRRLAVGAYFVLAAIVALLRIASARHITNPYIKPAASSILVAGTILLGSGLWAAIVRKNSS